MKEQLNPMICHECQGLGLEGNRALFCDMCRWNIELVEKLRTCPVCDQVDMDGLEACSGCYNGAIATGRKVPTVDAKLPGTWELRRVDDRDPDLAAPFMQKTFFVRAGDFIDFESEINRWLAKMGSAGFEIMSRDQVSASTHGDPAGTSIPSEIYITFTMVKQGETDEVARLKRHLNLLQLAFKHKEELIAALGEVERLGLKVTWENLTDQFARQVKPRQPQGQQCSGCFYWHQNASLISGYCDETDNDEPNDSWCRRWRDREVCDLGPDRKHTMQPAEGAPRRGSTMVRMICKHCGFEELAKPDV